MAESYEAFGSCILFKEIFEDDLGHLFRAGVIKEGAIGQPVWLRILDSTGIPAASVAASFEDARLIGETLVGAQVPTDPLFVEADGIPALGSAYVAGQPLNHVLARARDEAFPLQPDNTLLIVEKLALALVAAKGVKVAGVPLAHGFLHPGLIYLSNDGEATVTGFGVGGALLGALENPDSVLGARAYLAPEVLASKTGSLRGDVYSLGAILFHLLTGTALPAAPTDRMTALEAARAAWDGEELAPDIRRILGRSLDPNASDRYPSVVEFRAELDTLIYGGAYSPTTFNLALFMDRLFRSEIEEDEIVLKNEADVDVAPFLASTPDVSGTSPTEPRDEEPAPVPESIAPTKEKEVNRTLWAVVGGVAVIGIAALIFWAGRGLGPSQPSPTPTPTAEEIAARRQAQDDRLRTMTQEMVQEMMAQREDEIREELIARQTRIEELQQRLLRSERRAAQSAAAAAKEAETQQALMQEIEEQEEAQRAQQDALEAELEEPTAGDTKEVETTTAAIVGAAALPGDDAPDAGDPENGRAADSAESAVAPTPVPTEQPILRAKVASVDFGEFVAPEATDTLPVVIKSQSLTWPRRALRSEGKGVVVVQLTVNGSGGVDEVSVLRADHTDWGIPEAAMEAASGYRFKPGTKDGVAITTHSFVTWRYDFTVE